MEPEADRTVDTQNTVMEASAQLGGKVRLEVYGEEMIEKIVKQSGNSGRVYLPPNWVGCRVKIIRLGREQEKEL